MQFNGITISPGITIGPGTTANTIVPEWIYKTTIYNSANTPIPAFGNMFGVNIQNSPRVWNNDVKIGNRITNLTTGRSSIVTDISYGYTYLQLNQKYANTSAIVYLSDSNAMPTGNSQNYMVESREKEIMLPYGTTSWTVPADWNNSNNRIQIWGAGGGGASVNSNTTYATGGGGGGYTILNNVALTPGQVITITIGQGGAAMMRGGNTSFGSYGSANGGGGGVISFGVNPQNRGTGGTFSGGHGGYHVTAGGYAIRGNGIASNVTKGGSGGGGAGYFDPTGGGGLGGDGGYNEQTAGGIGYTSNPFGGYGYSTPYTGGGGGAGSPGPGQYGYFSFGGPGGTPAGGGGAGLPTGGTGGNGQIFITYRPE